MAYQSIDQSLVVEITNADTIDMMQGFENKTYLNVFKRVSFIFIYINVNLLYLPD